MLGAAGVLGAWIGVEASAFAIYEPPRPTIEETFLRAERWCAEPDPFGFGTGLHDGIQVAVAPDFADRLGVDTAQERDLLMAAVTGAFAAWESPALSFQVFFDGPSREGVAPGEGLEIDLFAVPETHPAFALQDFFGLADVHIAFARDRLLTNGTRAAGWLILGADVFVNVDNVMRFAEALDLPLEVQAMALQRLLMHEIGHTLGLAHPNERFNLNYDTDLDPENAMLIDPAEPFADLIESPNRDVDAILSNDRSLRAALLFTRLRPDDRGGRDVLYPVPEPALHGLGVALAGVVALGARRRRPWRAHASSRGARNGSGMNPA